MWTHDSSPAIPPRAAALLLDRVAAPESQLDLTHHGLHRTMRRVSGDRTPLRAVEVLLLCLPAQEKGEKWGPISADGMHRYPPLGPPVHRVHDLSIVEVQQGMSRTLVLREEHRRCPVTELHRMPNRRGAAGVGVRTS